MLAQVCRWKNAGLVLGIIVLCSIAMTVALAGAGAPVDTGNVEATVSEASFPDPPMAPMADPPPLDLRRLVVFGSWSDHLTLNAETPGGTFITGEDTEDPQGHGAGVEMTLLLWPGFWTDPATVLWTAEPVAGDGHPLDVRSGNFNLWYASMKLTPQGENRAFTIKVGPDANGNGPT